MKAKDFKDRVRLWAQKIGVSQKLRSIHIRPMKNKLASCSSKGIISFDPCVLEMDREELDKIIVHELLHLRYKNHRKLFKMVLKAYLEEGL